MEKLEIGSLRELRVKDKRVIDGRYCYIVLWEDEEYVIRLLDFQRQEEEVPATLHCLLKDYSDDGRPIWIQDFGQLLPLFYKEGEIYPFKVRTDMTHIPHGYYEVSDGKGFTFRLIHYNRIKLYIGQHIKCKVVSLKGHRLRLELWEDETLRKASLLSPQLVAGDLKAREHGIDWGIDEFVDLLFSHISKEAYMLASEEWLLAAVKKAMSWGIDYQKTLMDLLRMDFLYLLENSNYFRDCDEQERHIFLERLSAMVDLVESYRQATNIINNNQHSEFIEALIEKLRLSGYLYRPDHQMRRLGSIFALRPEVMDEKMEAIFNVIREGNVENWRAEPFRRAFLKQLELYINGRRNSIDTMASADSVTQEASISKVVQALAIQLLLAKEEDGDLYDRQLNMALFFRALSYKGQAKADILLEKAFRSLLGVQQDIVRHYNWADTKDMTTLANKMTYGADIGQTATLTEAAVVKNFEGKHARLQLTQGGIHIRPLIASDNNFPILPPGLLTWHHPQIYSAKELKTNKLKADDLTTYRALWQDIEAAWSEQEQTGAANAVRKLHPTVGEEVYIRILWQNENKQTFFCRIEEDNFQGEGWLDVANIVPYKAHATIQAFIDPDTADYLLLRATVDGFTPEGHCIFKMSHLIRNVIHDEVMYAEEFTCLITDIRHDLCSGISADGFTFCVPYSSDMSHLEVGGYMRVRVEDNGRFGSIRATYLKEEDECFNVTDAFTNLMLWYADDKRFETPAPTACDESNDDLVSEEALLSQSYVVELMNLIDRTAVLCEDYVKAFNYLAFARSLALMAGNATRADYYKERMNLIIQLQKFANNGRVDSQELEAIGQKSAELVENYPELRHQFLKLQIISYLNKPEHNTTLWTHIHEAESSIHADLARLVLSYNLLSDLPQAQHEVQQKIYAHLSVKEKTSSLHYFGEEGQQTEFKTSIVYPSDKSMRSDIATQTGNIMRVVAGLLNADGGTLYLGVNDTGMGIGLEQDLAYHQFGHSRDKYDQHVRNSINMHLGTLANSYVSGAFIPYNGKLIYCLTVRPCPRPVAYQDTYYKRMGTSTHALTDAALADFMQHREAAVKTLKAVAAPQPPLPQAAPRPLPSASKDIATSLLRSNVLYDYEEGYVPPVAFLSFFDRHTWLLSSRCPSQQARLNLAIRPEEATEHLIMAYETGDVIRLQMKELLEKKPNITYSHHATEPLFISPAKADDALLSVYRSPDGKLCMRLDDVSTLPYGRIAHSGTRLTTIEEGTLVQCELLSAQQKARFSKSLNLKATTLGTPVTTALRRQLLTAGISLYGEL